MQALLSFISLGEVEKKTGEKQERFGGPLNWLLEANTQGTPGTSSESQKNTEGTFLLLPFGKQTDRQAGVAVPCSSEQPPALVTAALMRSKIKQCI